MPYNYQPGYPYYNFPPYENYGGWTPPGYFPPEEGMENPVKPKMKCNPAVEPFVAKEAEKKEEEETKN